MCRRPAGRGPILGVAAPLSARYGRIRSRGDRLGQAYVTTGTQSGDGPHAYDLDCIRGTLNIRSTRFGSLQSIWTERDTTACRLDKSEVSCIRSVERDR